MHALRAVCLLSLVSLFPACGSVTMTSGTGGQNGSGGTGTGGKATGGNHGSGGTGTGGATCSQLQDEWAAALQQARSCSVGSGGGQCDQQAASTLGCDCQTYVNDKSPLDPILSRWDAQGCQAQAVCPAIACLAPRSGACRASDAGGGTCADVYTP
jgi:hypothetical protein